MCFVFIEDETKKEKNMILLLFYHFYFFLSFNPYMYDNYVNLIMKINE